MKVEYTVDEAKIILAQMAQKFFEGFDVETVRYDQWDGLSITLKATQARRELPASPPPPFSGEIDMSQELPSAI